MYSIIVSGVAPLPRLVVHEVAQQFAHQWHLEPHLCAQQRLPLHISAFCLPILRVGGTAILRQ